MEAGFAAVLQKLAAEQGREVLLDAARCKVFLPDYIGNEYKKESRLLLLALDAGAQKAIDSAQDILLCRNQQIKVLQEEYSLTEERAADVVDTLVLVLRNEDLKGKGQASAQQQSSSAPEGFVRVDGGTFMMGSHIKEPGYSGDESPQHEVTVSGFYMGKCHVTQKEYQEVMGINPSRFKGDDLPVEQVSWEDAIEYCNKRSLKEGLTPAYRGSIYNVTCDWSANGYRLPTEAEWEFAAKGGIKDYLTTSFSGSNNADAVAWYKANSGNSPHPVGTKMPNSLGIYDMSGNQWELCWDWVEKYSPEAQTDPRGPPSGIFHVVRGGSWESEPRLLRAAFRPGSGSPGPYSLNGYGIRLVRL